MNREEFIKKLHPAITHIRCSDNMSEYLVNAINCMVQKALKMSPDELKSASEQYKRKRKLGLIDTEVPATPEAKLEPCEYCDLGRPHTPQRGKNCRLIT
jgi:hypothetical protein